MSLGEGDGQRDSRPFPDPEHSLAPRKPRTIGGAAYLVVLAATAAGLALLAFSRWRLGLSVVGGALLWGALARLVIPDRSSGMLGMRPKLVDVLVMGAIGAGLVVLAAVIPDQPAL